jgi:hypothetical protein
MILTPAVAAPQASSAWTGAGKSRCNGETGF